VIWGTQYREGDGNTEKERRRKTKKRGRRKVGGGAWGGGRADTIVKGRKGEKRRKEKERVRD